LEGIQVICRKISVAEAPARYEGSEYSRIRIPGGDD